METPRIDGFEVIEKLGEGGMASVWKARQISLDRIVAIKILSPHLAATTEDVNRFLKEARATAQLKHQGIVQVYDAKASKGLYCFVMEYIAGYTVGDWVRRKGCLSESDTLTVIDCIADAMDYAWNTTGVIHCDIKPDNIIIDADGTVKVADLGLAHTINAINVEDRCDEVMGTPAYISPEQAEGRTDLDCRSDIYSLGAMMYHMLTGKLMFQGESDEKIMEMQVSKNPIDAQKLNPEISILVNELLKKMLQKKRSKRPQDWAEVRRLLLKVGREITGRYGFNGDDPISSTVTGGLSPFEQRHSKYISEKIKNILMMRTMALIVGLLVVAFITRKACRPTSVPEQKEVSVAVTPMAAVVNGNSIQPEQVAVDQQSTSVDDNAREMFEFAKERQYNNHEQISESIEAFRAVAVQTRGTKYSLMAEDEINRLQEKLKDQIDGVMVQLDKKAKEYVVAGKLIDAARVYELYDGVCQQETGGFRQDAADLLRSKYEKRNKDKRLSQQRNRKFIKKLMENLPKVILGDGVGSANMLLKKALNNPSLKMYEDKLNKFSDILNDADNIDQHIIESFDAQIGEEITVSTLQGRFTVVITAVDNYRIVGRQDINVGSGVASSEIVFNVSDLTPREKISRMGDDDVASVALVKGIMAYESRAYGYARRFFETLDEPLAGGLLRQVDMQVNAEIEQAACDNLRLLLSIAGVDVPALFDLVSWRNALGDTIVDNKDINKITRLIDAYTSEYGDTDFVKLAKPIIIALKRLLEHNYEVEKNSFLMQDDEPLVDDSIKIKRSDLDLGWRNPRRENRLLDDNL